MSNPLDELEIFAAADPTATWTFTDSVDLRDPIWSAGSGGDPLRDVSIIVTPSGTSPASYELKMQTSADDTTWADEVMVLEVAAGAGPVRATILSLQDEDGTVLDDRAIVLNFTRMARRYVRWALKSTGGAGTDRLQVSRALARGA